MKVRAKLLEVHAGSEQLPWPVLLLQKVLLQIFRPVRLLQKGEMFHWTEGLEAAFRLLGKYFNVKAT